jgi:hypothetical protein
MLKLISILCFVVLVFISNSLAQGNTTGVLLYSQTTNIYAGAIISSYDLFVQTINCQAADDFIASEDWSISQVVVPNGSYFYPEMAEGFNIFIYKNYQNRPDSLIYFAANQSYSLENGLTAILLDNPAHLIAGHYWVSVQAITDMNNWYGEVWVWSLITTEVENEALYKDPGNPFGPSDWSPVSNAPFSVGKNMFFELYGSSKNNNVTGIAADEVNPPSTFELYQNYPNPFNPSTKISWQYPVAGHQSIKVYDVLGNEVATLVDEHKTAGSYEVEFDASNLSSGVYLYKLQAGNFVETKKMILLK